jgi:xanthine/CO dehydrogenase XdhC/CoxF family maturation factor
MNPVEFGALHAALLELEARAFAPGAALATVVRTEGATFRRAGTRMLVRADGGTVCALSGGCPQRDIVLRAQEAIAQGAPVLARYGRDSALDVLIEMGCGGELDVLIEPLRARSDCAFAHAVAEIQYERIPGVLLTRLAHDTAAVQRLVLAAGEVRWSEFAADTVAVAALARRHGEATSVVRMPWPGGGADALLEPIRPRQVLVLIGVNPVSDALLAIGAALHWDCRRVLDTSADPTHAHDPSATLAVEPDALPRHLPQDAHCAVLAMTFNYERDLAYLTALTGLPLGYVGAIASHDRSTRLRRACPGLTLFAPAGLDLGADNPQEIALAVVAEILAQRSARSARRLSAEREA